MVILTKRNKRCRGPKCFPILTLQQQKQQQEKIDREIVADRQKKVQARLDEPKEIKEVGRRDCFINAVGNKMCGGPKRKLFVSPKQFGKNLEEAIDEGIPIAATALSLVALSGIEVPLALAVGIDQLYNVRKITKALSNNRRNV